MAIRYDSKTWESRPTMLVWNDIKPYVGFQPGISETTLPPIFGWCVDQFREKHGIYISVTPHLQTVSKGETDSGLVFHFEGNVTKLNGGKIVKNIKCTGIDFLTVLNNCLSLAAEYLKSEG